MTTAANTITPTQFIRCCMSIRHDSPKNLSQIKYCDGIGQVLENRGSLGPGMVESLAKHYQLDRRRFSENTSPLLTIAETTALLGVSETFLRKQVQEGIFRCHGSGTQAHFSINELAEDLAALRKHRK